MEKARAVTARGRRWIRPSSLFARGARRVIEESASTLLAACILCSRSADGFSAGTREVVGFGWREGVCLNLERKSWIQSAQRMRTTRDRTSMTVLSDTYTASHSYMYILYPIHVYSGSLIPCMASWVSIPSPANLRHCIGTRTPFVLNATIQSLCPPARKAFSGFDRIGTRLEPVRLTSPKCSKPRKN
jgi:hypothetical protein